MDFHMFAPYIADQFLAESERRVQQRLRVGRGTRERSRRHERVT